MQFREHTLGNGLQIIAECNPRAYTLAMGFFVKTGSRDESDAISGVSHFLEHMVFKGTAQRSAEQVNREFDEMGAESNAYTTKERTVYHAVVLPEYQDRAAELLCDILRPALRETDFETEKQVILEEIAMYEDQPPFNIPEKCMAAFYGSHPLSRSVLGTNASVSNLTAAQMHEYFRRHYSPGKITLVAAGNVDFERLVALADRACGGWQPTIVQRESPAWTPQHGFQLIHRESSTQQHVLQMAAGPAVEDHDRFAARLLAAVIGDDSGSRFYWELVDTGLADCAEMDCQQYQGSGAFTSYLCCLPDDTAENLACMAEILREVACEGIDPDELERAKSKIRSQIVLRSERPGNRLFAVGGHWLHQREYQTVREAIERYDSVTLEQIAAVMEKYPLDQMMTYTIGPLKELAS